MFSSFGGGDQTVFDQTFSFEAIDDSTGVMTAPINIEKTGLHCIELHASILTNNTEGFVFKGSSKRLNSSFSFDKRTPEAPTYNKAAFLLKYNEDLSIQVLNDLESTSTVQEQKDSIF